MKKFDREVFNRIKDQQAYVDKVNLKKANLSNAYLVEGDFEGRNLSKANLRFAQAESIIFNRAKLRKADLRSSILQYADLYYADCTGANFSNANMTQTELHHTDLTGAKLQDACLDGIFIPFCKGNGKEIKNIEDPIMHITYTKDVLAIDLFQRSIEEWKTIRFNGESQIKDWWLENGSRIINLLTNAF